MAHCPVLVERDDELRTLSRLASQGGTRLVVITGEAGTGKSRLAREFASSLPDEWAAPTATITRTRGALPVVPHPRPLALIVEDAHFLEPAALAAIPARLDELDDVLLVLAFRLGLHAAGSAEMRALARLVRDPRAHELRLMPLSPAGVSQMAAAMGRYASEDLYPRTGGNPFWAEQVLGGGDAVPWTVVESVTSQLDALPPAARELACALAVADEAVPATAAARLAAAVAGEEGAAGETRAAGETGAARERRADDAAWAALADAGLVERYPAAAIALRHALVDEAVRARLGPAERVRWHARLAEALGDEHVPRDRVARHWAAAGEIERAAPLARAAAAELRAQGATRRAFDCYEIAVRRPPPDPEAAGELHEEAPRRGSARSGRCTSGSPPASASTAPPAASTARSACGSTPRSTTCPSAGPARSATSRSSGCSSTRTRRWGRATRRRRAASSPPRSKRRAPAATAWRSRARRG